MTLVRIALLILLLVPVAYVAQVELAGCHSYEPATVGLHGKLVRETFAGPPNYHDVRKGDEAETVWLVTLDSPICINQDEAEPDLNPSQKTFVRYSWCSTRKMANGRRPCGQESCCNRLVIRSSYRTPPYSRSPNGHLSRLRPAL
jgi:hypothetical protein